MLGSCHRHHHHYPLQNHKMAISTSKSSRLFGTRDTKDNSAATTTTPPTSTPTTTTTPANAIQQHPELLASHLGRDPLTNTRHCPLVYHRDYSFQNWPSTHTFPMDKFARLAEAILTTPVDVEDWDVDEEDKLPLVLDETDFFRPLDYNAQTQDLMKRWLCGPLNSEFVQDFLNAQLTEEQARHIGFREQTYRPELIRRTVLEVAGTLLTAQLACQYGLAANLAGGTHHADHKMGAGYTILNDLVVTAHYMTTSNPPTRGENTKNSTDPKPQPNIDRVLVIDCDVHQGDGTARCMREVPALHDKLFTLSLHCASNYPHPKACSTWDIGLPDKMQDAAYLEVLRASVETAISDVNPDLVLYDAGVDIYRHDKLGRLHISEGGIRQRDAFVVESCVVRHIPIACVIGGGYDKDVHALARRHAILHEECSRVWRKYELWNRRKPS